MGIAEFLSTVIDDGIQAARESYSKTDDRTKMKLAGSIAGFEACRVDTDVTLHLIDLLRSSKHATRVARESQDDDYWWYRCYEAEVEWVCNCISAVMVNHGMEPIITPTMSGVQKAASIVGVIQ